jgi:small ubiquitin-related modifier
LHHDPDGDVDDVARARRVSNTKAAYKALFGHDCTWAFDQAPSTQPVDSTDGYINIKVSGRDGAEVFCKSQMTKRLGKMMMAVCKHMGHTLQAVRFTFDGRIIGPQMTPLELKMEDGDTIDMIEEQSGCPLLSLPPKSRASASRPSPQQVSVV